MAGRINAYLVSGGKYHDFDFARLELLKLLAEHEGFKVKVGHDSADVASIDGADVLITYTCDVRPEAHEIDALKRFLARGGRWFALHGTNALIDVLPSRDADCLVGPQDYVDMLGSRFLAHPDIGQYDVRVKQPDHPIVAGISDFKVEDEQYLQELYEPERNQTLLVMDFEGEANGDFRHTHWEHAEHPVMYLRAWGGGEILYLTLGHCRGKYDIDGYPDDAAIKKCSWQLPVFYELLRRGIRWTMEGPVLSARGVTP